jgi:indolepyruvate ferredoxin oxidoreductase
VQRVRDAETKACPGKTSLSDAVARNLYKLMAYKDEYEVARLHTDPDFLQSLRAQFEGEVQLHYRLAPPLLARTNDKGELVKQDFGPWVLQAFGVLKHLRFLRGTALDVFGYTEERRTERALIDEYRAAVERALATLSPDTHAQAVTLARTAEGIKGYGHVKARHLAGVREKWASPN